MASKKMSEILYNRYEYLAAKHASKIFAYEELSLEYEDLLQEFRIKIFMSIKAYARRWRKYRKQGINRPLPIKFYLEAACSNKVRDFIKLISKENHKARIDGLDGLEYDFGVIQDSEIDLSKNRFIVNGIDLMEGLSGKERMIFSLYLRGYNRNFLSKVYYSKKSEKDARQAVRDSGDEPFTPQDIIDMQRVYLIKKYGADLIQSNNVYVSHKIGD